MAAKKFDVTAFIKGVGRRSAECTLCTDATVRSRIDALMAELAARPQDDESLAGDPRREEILAELQAAADDTDAWTVFEVRAPSHLGRMEFSVQMVSAPASEDGNDLPAESAEKMVAAEARLVADCVVKIAGHAVDLTFEQAAAMLTDWPDDLSRELIDAINELGGPAVTVPFSRRLSETLTTQTP